MQVDVDVDLGIDVATGLPVVSGDVNDVVWSAADWSQFNGLGATVRNLMISFVEPELPSSVGSVVLDGSEGLFEGLFAGMDVTLPAAGFPVGRLDGTADVTVALARRHALDLRNNGLTLPTGLRVTAPPPPPNATGRVPLPLFGNRGPPVPPGRRLVGRSCRSLQPGAPGPLARGPVRRDGRRSRPGSRPSARHLPVRPAPNDAGRHRLRSIGLDVGALDLVVTHPDLPPGLRVAVGAGSVPRLLSSKATLRSTTSRRTSCMSRPEP